MQGIRRPPFLISALVAALIASLAGGCGSTSNLLAKIEPYRIDIVQGNVVTRELAAQIRLGMTRQQVKDILGSPMVMDAFHADRWDYVFMLQRPGLPVQHRSFVVHFQDDRLIGMDTTELPSEREFVASITPPRGDVKPPKLELSEPEIKALPAPARSPAPPAPASAPERAYPPLEPQ